MALQALIALSCFMVRFALNHIYKGNEPYGPYSQCPNRIEGLNGRRYDAQDDLVPHLHPPLQVPERTDTFEQTDSTCTRCFTRGTTASSPKSKDPGICSPTSCSSVLRDQDIVIVYAQGTSPSSVFSALAAALGLVESIRK